ncbi:hypothetical protein ANCCAN_02220 [Ancylostoma caninum]|uniref:Uncharacterized protein n=1 Tax=Ancylostoma caninum TaxID=29170 RepID=A0A368H4Q6_ANCCA|nr:hypothetical protein ANCCAN_02220 [Ancylostoma caninum]
MMTVITVYSQILESFTYLMLVFTIALWSGFVGCCRREKRDVCDTPEVETARELEPLKEMSDVKTAVEESEKSKEDKTHLTVQSIHESPKASLEVQETQPYSNIMSTQLSLMPSDYVANPNLKWVLF